jgi:hypothetical protein
MPIYLSSDILENIFYSIFEEGKYEVEKGRKGKVLMILYF